MAPEILNDRQFETLSQLVGAPSVYTQIEPVGSEREIQELIWEMLSGHSVRLSQQPVGREEEGRFNIIAQKGTDIEKAEYVVMVYVHVDTIKKKPEWGDRTDYRLRRDGEFLKGIGVYDMKAGAMLLTDLLQTMDVPEGMTVVGAYCVGEERDSDGIKELMGWQHIGRVNLVVSPEIASMGNDEHGDMRERDDPKSVICGRPGNAKTQLYITSGGGHAFDTGLPNTNEAMRMALNHLAHTLSKRDNGVLRAHPDFGDEHMNERDIRTVDGSGGEFESIATKTRAMLTFRLVPPSTAEETRHWAAQEISRLRASENWDPQGLGAEIGTFGTSYDPYIGRTDSPDAQAVLDAARAYYGDARFDVGLAVADGNLGHKHMNRKIEKPNRPRLVLPDSTDIEPCDPRYVPWLEIGPLGQGPHKSTERVYEASLVRLIEFYQQLFQRHLPDYLSSRK